MNNVKQTIGWADYTINPVKWKPEIKYDPSVFIDLPIKPSRIFVGSTMELFGGWNLWMDEIISLCERIPEHTFIFLTKQPQNLIKWNPYPENCWVGVSATDAPSYQDAYRELATVEAKVRFISFEPLLGAIFTQGLSDIPRYYNHHGFPFDWVIIGAQTPYSPKTAPKIEWVKEIIEAADNAGIPVFLKDNLQLPKYSCDGGIPFYKKQLSGTMELRQEFPLPGGKKDSWQK